MQSEKSPSHRFTLKGFSQEQGFRRFLFEGPGADQVRREFAVYADLALIRTYGIHLQELPLLCRELLERRVDSEARERYTFTEEDMQAHFANCRALKEAAALRRKMPKRPPSENVGAAWRTSPLSPFGRP